MNCSLPGASLHGILQARTLEWVANSLLQGPSQPRDQTHASCIAGRFFTIWSISDTGPKGVYLSRSMLFQQRLQKLMWVQNQIQWVVGFQQLKCIIENENSKSVCVCESGNIQNPVSQYFTQENEAQMLTPHINTDSGRVRLGARGYCPQIGPSLRFSSLIKFFVCLNTCKPMAVLFQCMTKFTTNKKKKKKKKKVRNSLNLRKWSQSVSVQLFVTPWTVAHLAPLSMEFFRQEYWSG